MGAVLLGDGFGGGNGGYFDFHFLKREQQVQGFIPRQFMGGFQGFFVEEHFAGIAKPFGGHARFGNADQFEVKVDSQSASPGFKE